MLTACHLWHMFCHFQIKNHNIRMKKYLYYCLVIVLLFACAIPQKSTKQQGISGKVLWLEGNLMPTIGDSTYQQRANGIPVQRMVLIFEATTKEQVETSNISTLYSKVNNQLIEKIDTDENGEFMITLAPGKYSLFVQEKEDLFANVFDGQGIINPVTVEAGKFTDIVIKVNYKAVF